MPDINELLLNKFFHSRCSEKEAEQVLNWLLDPRNKGSVKAMMMKHWEATAHTGTEVDIDSLLVRTQRLLRERQNLSRTEAQPKRRWFHSVSFRVAASLALICICASVLVMVLRDNTVPHAAVMMADREEVSTSTGQIILKVLPDGTKVWLNAQSKLEYPAEFGKKREVILKGEAFFDVAEDTQRPFIVHADDINIRVLGTAFNIKSYPGDPSIATTLIRGKVLIENDKGDRRSTIELEPNQQAVFSHSSKDIALREVNAERYASWTDGTLVFEDDKVYDVFKTLERWYGVTINAPEASSLSCRLTARIDKETITETLELLRSITGIDYTISDNEVTIEGKICIP